MRLTSTNAPRSIELGRVLVGGDLLDGQAVLEGRRHFDKAEDKQTAKQTGKVEE
jgi:hypothetical protein